MEQPQHTHHFRSWKRPSLKRTKSFFIKLVHPQPSLSDKPNKPHRDASSPDRIKTLPPAYEIAIQTPFPLPPNPQTQSSERVRECKKSANVKGSKVMGNPSYASSSSSAHLPLAPLQSRVVPSAPQEPEDEPEIESLAERRCRRTGSSQQICNNSHHHFPSKKTGTAHKSMRASSTGDLNAPRNINSRRLDSQNRRTRRDRELIAAKKSLPILTKYSKPNTTNKNTSLF